VTHEAAEGVYGFDPLAAPDSDFEPGELGQIVEGNAGRLLDARRTPVTVRAVDADTGMFEVEVTGFEDAGAGWWVALEEVDRFQFARASRRAGAEDLSRYRSVVARLDQWMTVQGEPGAAATTRARICEERQAISTRLSASGVSARLDADECIARRAGDPGLVDAVQSVLAERGLADVDEAFAAQYVSNPWSGELVKGHAIVAAELGLCPYRGKVVRDTTLFDAAWSKERRGEHLIVRIALTAELWSRTGRREVTLYRAAATDRAIAPRPAAAFVSATFSREVADAHFAGGPTTRAAVMSHQAVGIDRLLMTFWETAAMNRNYHEAEAVVVGLRELPF
jgi:hypothetical protein